MSDKEKNLKDMLDCGVIAIIRVGSAHEALEVCNAIAGGGIKSIEITMTVPSAIDVIKQFAGSVKDDIVVGAGTVLDPQTAGAAIMAGAEFIVSPTLNLEVIKVCRRYNKIAIPGTLTPTEILTAWEAGGDVIKVFPATIGGPQYLRDIKGPLPQVRLCPTGGVSLENTPGFIKAGAAVVAVGTSLVEKKALSEKEYGIITENARRFVEAVRVARAA